VFPEAELTRWMDERGLGAGPITGAVALTGGTQNVMVRFRRGDDEYVFRRPPMAKRRNSDETMRREATVLAALRGSAVPHPELLAAEPGTDVIGAAFYLAAAIDGTTVGDGLSGFDDDRAATARLGLAMADGIAALAQVDHRAVGLQHFGRPGSFLVRQVARWQAQLATYADVPGWAGPGVDVAPVGAWLGANRPATEQVGILHGDYHLGNVIFAPDGGLAAIVDWELATIGDPLLDLAQLLVTWPDPTGARRFAAHIPPEQAGGLTSPAHIVEHYALSTGWDLSDLDWYRVLAGYRLGIILEGTRVRAVAGQAPPEIGDMLHDAAVGLLTDALHTVRSA
jgi:aminoglycoside phosphotransferase (APT) family kinase protein